MAGSFQGRLSELVAKTGSGGLSGRVVFNQIYAAYQHNSLELNHPQGGQAMFLTNAIVAGTPTMMQRLADAVLDGDLLQAMITNVERTATNASRRAPVEFWDLRKSANPQVRDNGKLVYNRPPEQRRLTEEETKQKVKWRNMGLGNKYPRPSRAKPKAPEGRSRNTPFVRRRDG